MVTVAAIFAQALSVLPCGHFKKWIQSGIATISVLDEMI